MSGSCFILNMEFRFTLTDTGSSVNGEALQGAETKYRVDVLVNSVTVEGEGRHKLVQPVSLNETGEPAVVVIPLSQVWFRLHFFFLF